MKNLTDFINEQMIMELSSDTYLDAAKKAMERGDTRVAKFLRAAAEEAEKESNGKMATLNKYYQEDKHGFAKLNKIAKNWSNRTATWIFGDTDHLKNSISVSLVLGTIGKDSSLRFLPREYPSDDFYNPFKMDIDSAKYIVGGICIPDNIVCPVKEGYFAYEVTTDTIGFIQMGDDESIDLPDCVKETIADLIGCFNPNSEYTNPNNLEAICF